MPTICSDRLEAHIESHGAQMVSLRHHLAGELLWQGDTTIWADHAPILFPTVGRVRNDTLMLEGRPWPMPTHGIAKLSTFAIARQSSDRISLALTGHEAFPYRFRLKLDYAIADETLTAAMTIENHEPARAMPVNFGFHPGFVWPLPGAPDKTGHMLRFAESEDVDIRRLMSERLVAPHDGARLVGQTQPLSEDLFIPSAMMLPGLRSRSVTFFGPTSTQVTIDFPDFPVLGLWMRGGGNYVCIEPWHALPQAEDSVGDYSDQPGVLSIPPGGSHTASMSITVSGKGTA